MLRVRKGKKQAHQRFFITSLGNDCVILGYPWLEEFNPEIDWSSRTMKGTQVQLEMQTLAWQNWRQGQATIRLVQMQPEWEAGNELIIMKTHFAQEWAIAEKVSRSGGERVGEGSTMPANRTGVGSWITGNSTVVLRGVDCGDPSGVIMSSALRVREAGRE
jgi:hypothetical protein